MPKEPVYTIEDIFALPDRQRAELIDGTIYAMAPPTREHQRIVTEVSAAISQHIRFHKGGCEVYAAPFAVILNRDDDTCVEPDITVVCDPDRLSERGCEGAPDWVIEVVSRSSREMDYYVKLMKYRSAGVRVYWIIDPLRRAVRVYNFMNEDETADYSFEDSIPAVIYPGFSLCIGALTESV